MISVHVRAEQVRTLYRQTLPVLAANCVNALIVSAVVGSSVPRSRLIAWLALMGSVSLARAELLRRYRKGAPAPEAAEMWGVRFAVGSAAAGVGWGLAGFLFSAGAGAPAQLFICFVLGGMCAAAAGTLASYLPAFAAFVLPALAGLCLCLAALTDSTHQVMALVTVLYGLGLLVVARVNHRALAEAFSLRFENADLLTRLSVAQNHLTETNYTLEKRVEERSEALRKQSAALRDAQRMEAIGRLAGGVAHDFNNLLTVILANISELTRCPALDPALRGALKEMRDAGGKGADLVQQLLMFSRQQRTIAQTIDLNRTLTAMDRLFSRLLGKQLKLEVVLQEAPLFVHVDPTQLEQVIINLITNARDAMPNGGVVTLRTTTLELAEATDGLEPGAYALLSVSDTGMGMDSETRQHIFEPFFTTKEVGKGTGLGLATVYGIVEQSGGHIGVSSEPAQGSCFRVYLPLATASLRKRADSDSSLRPPSGLRAVASAARGVTILLVEDEPTVRSVTRRILEKAGHRVLVAQSAEQALGISSEYSGPIELLVTDVVMAGIEGPELGARLLALRPGIRILFISGYSRHHVLAEDDPSGGVTFLPKPFTYESLMGKVTALLAAPARLAGDVAEARVAAGDQAPERKRPRSC
jgi:signal transduction histidine kinase/CheY-like chemotaxis protein